MVECVMCGEEISAPSKHVSECGTCGTQYFTCRAKAHCEFCEKPLCANPRPEFRRIGRPHRPAIRTGERTAGNHR